MKFRNGSEAAKDALLMIMAAFSQKAELSQACLSMLFSSEFGQEQSIKQTSICSECASFVKVIVCIEDPVVIRKILAHLNDNVSSVATALPPRCRAPPRAELLE
jgi:hypothetical protein